MQNISNWIYVVEKLPSTADCLLGASEVPGEVVLLDEEDEFPELALVLLHQGMTAYLMGEGRETGRQSY